MFEWFIDLFTTIITWVLSLFGIDYGKIGSVEGEKQVEVVPTVDPVVPLEANLP